MLFVMIKCCDCDGFQFAIPKKYADFYESNGYLISEFVCPSCHNQVWKEDSEIVGEFEYNK